MKKLVMFGILLLSILAFASVASAIEIKEVEVDGSTVYSGNVDIKKDNTVEVKVVIRTDAGENFDNVQIGARLWGDENDDDISDITESFRVKPETTYSKKLTLDLPVRMDRDQYTLVIEIRDRTQGLNYEESYVLDVEAAKHAVDIRDVIVSPSNGVRAGRAMLATVRVENRGTKVQEDVKVTFSIPELGLSASDYIDELAEDGDSKDSKSSEELYLRIPECTPAGMYEGVVDVYFKDGDKVTSENVDVEVFEDGTCELTGTTGEPADKAVISVSAEAQEVVKGSGGAVYPLTITNTGVTSKTFVVSVVGGDWATFRVSPNVVTVDKGETKTAYVFVSANEDATAGSQSFNVEISSGSKTLKQVALMANVVEGQSASTGIGISLKQVLEYGLFLLLVILVLLGLVIGFRKLKNNDEDNGEEGQSYY